MTHPSDTLLSLLEPVLGAGARGAITDLHLPEIHAGADAGDGISRAAFAIALSVALHHDLLNRVPTGAAYVADCRAAGRPILLDHGALRTIALPDGAPTGAIPAGIGAFTRILDPLGYAIVDTYPLDRLRMTGYAFCHRDDPEGIAQYFVSELHVDRFDDAFAAAAARVFAGTVDVLDDIARRALDGFARDGRVSLDLARAALPVIVRAFDRNHPVPGLEDYGILKAASAEAAWIATEGNAFNHGTDRVDDVEAVADAQRAAGRSMKDRVEVSGSGRVRQTACRADWVERPFRDAEGRDVTMSVPGSFYEFISRDPDPATGRLDLRFDSGNAQGIFKMTEALDA
jgi:hypothetical protein